MDEATRQLVRTWLTKARNDLVGAGHLGASTEVPLDLAIYHCQQAAEKAVKGFLVYHGHTVERTHDIERLVEAALLYDATFSDLDEAAGTLTPYAIAYRYPDEALEIEPSRAAFDEALRLATDVLAFVQARLPAEVHHGR